MRLIDADALEKLHCEDCSAATRGMCEVDPICASLMWVREAPTIDAVEVVRCKDCKHYENHRLKVYENCVRNERYIPMLPDDFCSYGERRDESCGGMKPIINQIIGQMHTEYENEVMRVVQSYGFDVDKDRLSQALHDAQRFYMEGYNDAMRNPNRVEVVRCKDCEYYVLHALACRHEHMNGVMPIDGFCSNGKRRVAHESL